MHLDSIRRSSIRKPGLILSWPEMLYLPYTGRAFAFLLSNENHTPLKRNQKSRDYLENWRISIDVLEAVTNLDFFPDLNTRSANVIREQCVATRWR